MKGGKKDEDEKDPDSADALLPLKSAVGGFKRIVDRPLKLGVDKKDTLQLLKKIGRMAKLLEDAIPVMRYKMPHQEGICQVPAYPAKTRRRSSRTVRKAQGCEKNFRAQLSHDYHGPNKLSETTAQAGFVFRRSLSE
ncbi:hypothetical protein DFH11DRAFT_1547459 [Phellopilus nigrolimitatus]|nr:hypothetical protein DFH11DRAFT_1547459 [Phellopilus nigrolimitatus]